MRGSRQGPADASCVRPGGRGAGVACESAQFFSPGSAPAKNALSRGAVAARQQGPNSQFCVVNAPPRLSEKSQNFLKVCLRHTGLPSLPAAGFGPGPCGAGGPAGPAFQGPGTLFGAGWKYSRPEQETPFFRHAKHAGEKSACGHQPPCSNRLGESSRLAVFLLLYGYTRFLAHPLAPSGGSILA